MATKLSGVITRKLLVHDGSRRQRPFFVQLDGAGIIRIWPRRCKPEEISVKAAYQEASERRISAEREAKFRANGKKRMVKRGRL